MQPPKPNGATAIIAGVLAILGGLFYLVGLIGTIIALSSGFMHWLFFLSLIEDLLLAGTLITGGVLLFLRKPMGRMLTIVGSGLAILVMVVSVVLNAIGVGGLGAGVGGVYLGGAIVGLLIVLIPAGATLTLAIVKPTALWCARQAPGAPGYPMR
jgi:hypothetical protein